MKALAILSGAAITIVACWAAGALVVQRLRLPVARQEHWMLAFLLGSAPVSTVLFVLGVAGLYYRGVFVAVAAAVVAAAVWSGAWLLPKDKFPRLPQRWATAYWAVYAFFGVNYFLNAMRPEISPDGSVYHLGLAARYLREHRIPAITDNLYDSLPKGLEMLFVFAFAFGRHSAAALVHFGFLVAGSLLLLHFGRRWGHPVAGMAASLFFFLSPVVALDGTTAYNDVALAAVLFGMFYLLELWRETEQCSILAAAGFMAGFAFAIKYTGIVGILFAIPYVVWRRRRHAAPGLFILLAAALVPAAAYPVKNAIVIGNPVAPFLNRWFPNPYMHVSFEEMARARMRRYPGLRGDSEIPLELTVRGAVLEGHIGPLYLLAPLALAAARQPLGRRVVAASIAFALPFAANVGARFLLPALAPLSLAMALAVGSQRWLLALLAAGHGVVSWPEVAAQYTTAGITKLAVFPWREALRLIPEEESLVKQEPLYAVAAMVERHTPADATVLLIGPMPEAYTSRRIVTYHLSARGERLAETLFTPLVPQSAPVKSYVFRFARQKVTRLRVVAHEVNGGEQWEIAEVGVYNGAEEVERRRRWRVTARPNPWDAPLAVDGNPVTRWKTWQTAVRGDFFEVDFGGALEADRVEVRAPLRHAELRLRLEGVENGVETEVRRAPLPQRMRRWAVAALEREGITHLVVADFVYGAQDLHARQQAWGAEFVAGAGGAKLYRLGPKQ
jgi:uncharacterized membrane protein